MCRGRITHVPRSSDPTDDLRSNKSKGTPMSLQDDNKAIVGRWFTDFWGKT
jgi:hypothetical protein